jgi:hypothetical protein
LAPTVQAAEADMARLGSGWGSAALFVAALATLAGCGDDSDASGNGARRDGGAADGAVVGGNGHAGTLKDGSPRPCVDGDERCGTPCGNGLALCSTGLHCLEDACAKACEAGSFTPVCGAERTCTPDGRCINRPPGAGGTGGSDGCNATTVDASPVTPTVILIVDQSGSMVETFDMGASRWNALRTFLLQSPGGLVADLQAQVRFGLALYSATADPASGDMLPTPGTECPMLTTVPVALDNFMAIQQVYAAAEPIDETPTGEAIEGVIDAFGLRAGVLPSPDAPNPEPVIFIVATDGEPDHCGKLNPQEGQPQAVAAAETAFGLGIRTFMISVGEDVSDAHMQDMANAGLGRVAGDPDAEFWVAGSDASLRQALLDIVGGQLSCEVALRAHVTEADACKATVKLNGMDLDCNDPDGFRLLDETTLELQGSACQLLKSSSGARVEVSFPCDVPIDVF